MCVRECVNMPANCRLYSQMPIATPLILQISKKNPHLAPLPSPALPPPFTLPSSTPLSPFLIPPPPPSRPPLLLQLPTLQKLSKRLSKNWRRYIPHTPWNLEDGAAGFTGVFLSVIVALSLCGGMTFTGSIVMNLGRPDSVWSEGWKGRRPSSSLSFLHSSRRVA